MAFFWVCDTCWGPRHEEKALGNPGHTACECCGYDAADHEPDSQQETEAWGEWLKRRLHPVGREEFVEICKRIHGACKHRLDEATQLLHFVIGSDGGDTLRGLGETAQDAEAHKLEAAIEGFLKGTCRPEQETAKRLYAVLGSDVFSTTVSLDDDGGRRPFVGYLVPTDPDLEEKTP